MRSFDADFANRLANHPAIRPYVLAPDGPIDLTERIADSRNVFLAWDRGGFLCVDHGGGMYEVHSMVLREGRGAETVARAREAIAYMFVRTDCMELHTKVPKGNVAARALARVCGFVKDSETPLIHGPSEGSVWLLTVRDWVRRSRECLKEGRRFHDLLGDVKDHGEHADHDRRAGAAVLMMLHGQSFKAQWLYNSWAVMNGYRPFSMQGDVVDIGTARLSSDQGEIRMH